MVIAVKNLIELLSMRGMVWLSVHRCMRVIEPSSGAMQG